MVIWLCLNIQSNTLNYFLFQLIWYHYIINININIPNYDWLFCTIKFFYCYSYLKQSQYCYTVINIFVITFKLIDKNNFLKIYSYSYNTDSVSIITLCKFNVFLKANHHLNQFWFLDIDQKKSYLIPLFNHASYANPINKLYRIFPDQIMLNN